MSRVLVPAGIDQGLVWHFGDPFAEQRKMFFGKGIHLLANREILSISGDDAISWFAKIASLDERNLRPGAAINSCTVHPDGKVQFALTGLITDRIWLWSEPGQGVELQNWLLRQVLQKTISVQLHPEFVLGWTGKTESVSGVVVSRPTQNGVGNENILPRELAEKLPENVGSWAWEAFRISAGIPRIGIDTDAETTLAELDNTVANPDSRRRLVRLLLDGSTELPEPGAEIFWQENSVGTLGSIAQHWQLGPIGLALVQNTVPATETLLVGDVSASQDVV